MRTELKIEESVVTPIIEKLLSQKREPLSSFRTDTRREYDVLYQAAKEGKFPDLLSITHKGLRLKKRHVHAPPRGVAAGS